MVPVETNFESWIVTSTFCSVCAAAGVRNAANQTPTHSQLPMRFDFYLTHQMAKTDYVKEWRLYVPKGF